MDPKLSNHARRPTRPSCTVAYRLTGAAVLRAQEARKAAAWHLAHTSARLEEARGQAEAQQAERTASMSHELAAERSELQQAEQARPHPHAYLLTP